VKFSLTLLVEVEDDILKYEGFSGSTSLGWRVRSCLVPKKICKIFQIFHHIESLDECMEH